jgi:hypothetical protein
MLSEACLILLLRGAESAMATSRTGGLCDLVQPERRNITANIGTFTAEKDGFTGTLPP